MPSVADRDGNRDALPTVLLEAFASGTSVVASRLTGIPEIVDDGENGFLVAPGDAGALADAIERLLTSAELRRRFGESAREKAERSFDLRANAAELLRLLTDDDVYERNETDAVRVPVH
jgi:glycosyltransferase involved in cell wall biosynthesis